MTTVDKVRFVVCSGPGAYHDISGERIDGIRPTVYLVPRDYYIDTVIPNLKPGLYTSNFSDYAGPVHSVTAHLFEGSGLPDADGKIRKHTLSTGNLTKW